MLYDGDRINLVREWLTLELQLNNTITHPDNRTHILPSKLNHIIIYYRSSIYISLIFMQSSGFWKLKERQLFRQNKWIAFTYVVYIMQSQYRYFSVFHPQRRHDLATIWTCSFHVLVINSTIAIDYTASTIEYVHLFTSTEYFLYFSRTMILIYCSVET